MSQPTPFDNILAQCRDLFCERLAAALAGMLDEADGALTALESDTRDPEGQKLYRETRGKVLEQRGAIETQFRARYLREFQLRSNRAKKIGDELADGDNMSSIELALVEEDDLNETLKFNAMTSRLRQYCEEELVALDQRVGVLFGDAGLLPEDNPFAPEAISDAFKKTCAQVDSNVDARLVLLKLFDEFVLDEIRGIYRAVNALLVQNSILPKLRGVAPVRKESSKKPPSLAAKESEQDLFALLKNMVAGNPAENLLAGAGSIAGPAQAGSGAAAGSGGAVQVLQGADLMRSLTRVQHGDVAAVTGSAVPLAAVVAEPGTTNVLRELKATNLGSGMSQMDSMTLDIVALLFDQLFDDPKIPIGVKGLIGRLQIPILKVAIADKAFFSKKNHPARQTLDTLGEVAARLPADVSSSNPTFVRLENILQELVVGFEDNIEIFDTVREQLETLITDEDQRTVEQTHVAEKETEQKEMLALAKTVAQAEIKLRTRSSRLPRSVLEFLFRQWIKVLLLIQVKEGEASEDWQSALDSMDLLIWSVEPKSTRDDKRELVGLVPELLKRLTDGLAYAGIEDEVRARFFADLRKLHSEVLAGNGAVTAAAQESASAVSAAAQYDSTVAEVPLAGDADAEITTAAAETANAPGQPTIEAGEATTAASAQAQAALELPGNGAGMSPTSEAAQSISELAQPDNEAGPRVSAAPAEPRLEMEISGNGEDPSLEPATAQPAPEPETPAITPSPSSGLAAMGPVAEADASASVAPAEPRLEMEISGSGEGLSLEPATAQPAPEPETPAIAPSPSSEPLLELEFPGNGETLSLEPATAKPSSAPDVTRPTTEVGTSVAPAPAEPLLTMDFPGFGEGPSPEPAADKPAPAPKQPVIEVESASAPAESPLVFELPDIVMENTAKPEPGKSADSEPAPASTPDKSLPGLEFPTLDFGSTVTPEPEKKGTAPEKPLIEAQPRPASVLAKPAVAKQSPAPGNPTTAPQSPVLAQGKPAAVSQPTVPLKPAVGTQSAQPVKPALAPQAPAAGNPIKPPQPPTAAPSKAATAVQRPASGKPAAATQTPQPTRSPTAPQAPASSAGRPSTAPPTAATGKLTSAPQPPARAGATQQPTSPRAAAPSTPTPTNRASPAMADKQTASAKSQPVESDALDMTAPVTINNPFGGGEIEVTDLDFTVPTESTAKGAKPASILPANLKLGTWVEIRQKAEKGGSRAGKLNFISQLKTRYLFVDRHGKTTLECSQAELVRLFQLGEVAITQEPTELPLFDRLAAGVANKLGAARR